MRRVSTGMPPLRAGLIALALICVGTYFIFSKAIPLRHHYEIRAVVENSNLLAPKSPVRIAGLDVGQVTSVARYRHTNLSVITMRIDDRGRPVHRDATLKIRPRLFLEGNFFVDLHPGTPSAPELPDRGIIPVSQTARPVQIDQVLTALDAGVRGSLQQTLQGFGAALNAPPTAAQDAEADPAVRGLSGGQALNKTFATSPAALRGSAIVNTALLGSAPHDLSRTIAGFARASAALARNEAQLQQFITDFDATTGTLAAQAPALEQTIALLGPTASSARRGFAALAAALPPTRQFARDLIPGVLQTPATIAAADPWLTQARPLLSKAEVQGLLDELAPASSDLARLGHATRAFLPRIDAFNRCVTGVILPTGNLKVDDGALSAGVENYKEFWYAMVAQGAEGASFDGNGTFLRLAAAGGPTTIETGKTNWTGEPMFGNVTLPPLGTRPAYPNRVPPLSRVVPCANSPIPDVNGAASHGPADGSRPGAAPPAVPHDPNVTVGTP
jgi:phospholipid/cholesterol/gamma-HCH transport system substrate-binding protein